LRSSYRNGYAPQLPLLLIETRPPDSGVFNRTDYYRTALKLLDEPFYERRSIVDIDTSEAWEKKGRGRSSKTSQFNDSIEATEGEQKLSYMESRREHLWHLLQIGMGSTDVPTSAVPPETPLVGSVGTSSKTESPPKTKRTRKKPNVPFPQEFTTTTANDIPVEPAPKKKQTRKKTTSTQTLEITETPLSNSSTDLQAITQDTQQQTDKSREKKSGTRVGQRTPLARHCWA
jgi:hypothetical protein